MMKATTSVLLMSFAAVVSGAEISDTATSRLPESDFVLYRGVAVLPADGFWQVRSVQDEALDQLYLVPSEQARHSQLGVRLTAVIRQRRTDQGRWKVQSVYQACSEYAQAHDGRGPSAVTDFDAEKYGYLRENLQTTPWYRDSDLGDLDEVKGPFVFLVPNAKFHFTDEDNPSVPADKREVLAVELRPYIDDGQHWVLYTDRSCLRQEVDAELLKKFDFKIRPVIRRDQLTTEDLKRSSVKYTFVAVRRSSDDSELQLSLFNTISGDERRLNWDLSQAKEQASVIKSLKQARQIAWSAYIRTSPAPILRDWLSHMGNAVPRGRGRRGNELSMFSVLGGRAAIEETLQLQNLDFAQSGQAETVDVASIEGVQVQSHPYEEMLQGQPGGELDLANVVPDDRFMVYVSNPDSILPFLDHGTEFLASAGAGFTGNRIDYDLTDRYMERLGLNRQWLESILRAGVVKDLAVVLPDLFVIDGTDVTVAARLERPALLNGLLQLLGVRGLSNTSTLTRKTASGGTCYWALRDDLFVISTHADELDRVLDLAQQGGEGSLGQSAEFRYMLTQLPISPETRIFAYFSDPFIRRLVGPQVKLSQLRRMKARAAMELLTSRSLLAQLDGVNVHSVQQLKRLKYLPSDFPSNEYSIDELGLAYSKSHGPLPDMKTLPETPIDQVTPAEAEAYRRYVEEYSSYWRQFFDPIAIRLDDTPEGELELTTFILPLIDSSIYRRLRGFLAEQDDERELLVPKVEPTPVIQFSVNLGDNAWRQIVRDFSGMFRRFGGASPAMLDDLGPGFHLAIFDADPVIALGSGDVMGAFGGNVLRGSANEMMMVPVVLSLLTRPSSIFVETRDAERTARFLRQAASGWSGRDRGRNNDFRVSFYQVGDQDAWVWSMEIVGLIKLRFGLEVTDRFLVIRNIPWSSQDQVIQVEEAALRGAQLTATPAACRLQLPGLFASAADQERRAVFGGIGRLYPFVAGRSSDVEAAAERHAQLFGFRPIHPASGEWQWRDMKLASSIYGTVDRQRQPAYDPQRPFGLMQSVDSVKLSMQFEDDGLRSKVTWRFRQPD